MFRTPEDPGAFDAFHPRRVAPLVACLATEAYTVTGQGLLGAGRGPSASARDGRSARGSGPPATGPSRASPPVWVVVPCDARRRPGPRPCWPLLVDR